MDKRMIYLDNAATTGIAPEVLETMLPYLREEYGNPSAIYSMGSSAKKAVNHAKRTIAGILGAKQEEIFFTAGGTESDNWALKAVMETYRDKGRHLITTKIEHHAVLHTCRYLEEQGVEVTYLGVDRDGLVDPEELKRAIRPDTVLISIMFANNEIGTVEPIKEIGAIARERGILFHTDAVQAFGQLPIHVEELNIDLLSASGHKINGPKGIGFLYIRSGLRLNPLIHGGAQESGRRAGTENVPGIVGMAVAAQRAVRLMQEKTEKETRLRDYLIERIEQEIPYCRLNGHRTKRLPGNVNFSFRFVQGEALVIMLDRKGICTSSGSACTSGALDPSHVLLALGMTKEEAEGSLRITLSEANTKEEIEQVLDSLKEAVAKLRSMSVGYEDFCRRNMVSKE
ncbi:MAG: cysteine desulfurase NifS [Acetatifactor sp.]